jgi:hypothetical protein
MGCWEGDSANAALAITRQTGQSVRVTTDWLDADAWFFECVGALMPQGGDLQRVIRLGDYINKAVFNHDEIEGAVRRLSGSGLLDVQDLQFRLTEAGAAIRDLAPKGASVYERMKWFRQYLRDSVECTEREDWRLSRSAYDKAFQDYQAKMRAAIDRMS